MTGRLTTEECLTQIELHSAGLAEAARGNLAARVTHCPDWSVADLVWHVTEVHWFWGTIAEERLQELPDESRRPSRPSDNELLANFEVGARRLVRVLRDADQTAACWTWAPQKDVAFVTRHQVQEAAVHHWDAANARGRRVGIDPRVAVDAVEEFLTFSVSSPDDPSDPPRPPLDGALWICACLGDDELSPTWLVTDGATPGTVTWQSLPEGTEPADVVETRNVFGGHADPVDVLLWLYARTPTPFEDGGSGDARVVERFRALCYTD